MISQNNKPSSQNWRLVLVDLLLILVLGAAAALRLVGWNWGEYQYLHPDERFLVWVGTDISPAQSLAQYFDAANSPLNPANRGHAFYVYGTLPMFLTRYLVEAYYHHSGFVEMTNIGRPLSALFDVLTVLLVYMVAERLYGKRAGLLASAFSAFTVLQIQQSHFFTTDTFITFFTFLAIYFAVRVSLVRWQPAAVQDNPGLDPLIDGNPDAPTLKSNQLASLAMQFLRSPLFLLSLGFGLALGSAAASKISAAPVALMLPGALALYLYTVPREKRSSEAIWSLAYLALAAVVSIVVFRIFQPYAFSGPGFFGIKPNPQWLETMRELRDQQAGDIDFPPSLQWARRPVWFSGQNMVLWGLGLPLGILSWAGFLWAGWRMLKGELRRHVLLWGWVAFFFTWQSLAFNPTMRYQLPVYPALAVFAGWAVIRLWDDGAARLQGLKRRILWKKAAAVIVGGFVLVATAVYAVAFTGIYARPITRIAASRWIYQNIPGPANLRIQTADGGVYNQPLPFPYNGLISPSNPYITGFTSNASGTLTELYLAHASNQRGSAARLDLTMTISDHPGSENALTTAVTQPTPGETRQPGDPITLALVQPLNLSSSQVYYLSLALPQDSSPIDMCGLVTLHMHTMKGEQLEENLTPPEGCLVSPGQLFDMPFTPSADSTLDAVSIRAGSTPAAQPAAHTLQVRITGPKGELATGSLSADFTPGSDGRGKGFHIVLDQPLAVTEKEIYSLALTTPDGTVTLEGDALANEGDWDDGIPYPIDGYNGFGGIYPTNVNFNMYPDENQAKRDHFLKILNESDYIAITSSRQWGSLPRLPERFPLVTEYYHRLIGCPPGRDLSWCFAVAKPGMFQGQLGFELVQVFQSDPSLGPLDINDQLAEEAFTVYDHPKVFIFKKTSDYNAQQVQEMLGAVDLTHVIHITPKKAPSHPADLTLPADRLAEQRQGGTWSELFNPEALQNKYEALGVILWYLAISVLGWLVYPLLRLALSGLSDRGYPLARTAGLVLLAYPVWLLGSLRVPFVRITIGLVLSVLAILGLAAAYWQRSELRLEWNSRRRYFVAIELLALGFFLFDLAIRFGNPDLWHQWKGGEKPMDFSYINAVLKSTSFPPYDPWYAGGYLNYYYYGFVLMGVLVKFLGIVPSFAFNLIIPTAFMLIAMGAFSVAWNIYESGRLPANGGLNGAEYREDGELSVHRRLNPFWVGFAAAMVMVVLGNLGTVQMIFRGYEYLIAPAEVVSKASLLTRWGYAWQGFLKVVGGAHMPYSLGDWYWIPSRVIPPGDYSITEFPFFTVLYADPHAHLFAMPVALLALGCAVSLVFTRARWKGWIGALTGLVIAALAIGALYPVNLSDIYTYLPLGMAATGYLFWCYFDANRFRPLRQLPLTYRRVLVAGASVTALAVLSFALYWPYRQWYGQAYSSVELWHSLRTPISSYLTHWGLFLFVMVAWMIWETRDWMASTPLSSLRKLEPLRGVILSGVGLLLLVMVGLQYQVMHQPHPDQNWNGILITWIALPLAAWAGILLLRPGLPDSKRIVLFLFGTGLAITMMVEFIVVKGDIGRQNTVFKFYLQAWTLFAVCSAAAFGWLLSSYEDWKPVWQWAWFVPLTLLVFSAGLFTLMGGTAKIKDRMTDAAPHTLDGMTYMDYATYDWLGVSMDLSQDYEAIRWMQDNVKGSPVIVEANSGDLYRWYSRYTIYTGLPGVVGWEWHEQQQRALVPPDWISKRLSDIAAFYRTSDTEAMKAFLAKYDVSYIVFGQLEKATYPGPGLDKFEAFDGVLWKRVYQQRDTAIYEVITP